MNSLVGRQVKMVRLHTPTHAKGLGNLGTTIDEDHKHKGNLALTVVDGGNILLTSDTNEGPVEIVLYAANIISAELKPLREENS